MKYKSVTCVIMDAIQSREPFAASAQDIFRRAAANWYVGCLSAKSITDIYYLTHRCTHSDHEARAILTKLFALFDILDTSALDCKKAVSSSVTDYEDAVMIETALSNRTDYIVSRHKRDDPVNQAISFYMSVSVQQPVQYIFLPDAVIGDRRVVVHCEQHLGVVVGDAVQRF